MSVIVVRPAPKPHEWDLIEYMLAEDGKSERLVYERTIDGNAETCEFTYPVPQYPEQERARVLARRPRDEMIFDALFVNAVSAYN